MKKICFLIIFVLSVMMFSEETKLDGKYNKNSVWSMCISTEEVKKDCGIIFKGNPYREFSIFPAEEPHGMRIEYRGIAIMSSSGEDLEIIETKSKVIPKKTKLVSLDESLQDVLTIVIGKDSSDVIALLPGDSFEHVKKYGKNVFYFNMVFPNYNVSDGSAIN